MMRRLSFMFLILSLVGCASHSANMGTLKSSPSYGVNEDQTLNPPVEDVNSVTEPSPLHNVEESKIDDKEAPKGVIFGKTFFEGLLKTSYVKLRFEALDESGYGYDLYLGDKARQASFLWDVKTIEPGYFFIELPVGKYKIRSISIPVGSTVAEEPADLDVVVTKDEVTYVGTIQAVGTKERIRLGGVPVIRPGFEYSISVQDDSAEAKALFHERFAAFEGDIQTSLIHINPLPVKE